MCDALFERDGGGFRPTPLANGPWHGGVLHGAAVAALFGLLVEEQLAACPGFLLNRLTMDFLRPVPNTLLQPLIEPVRDGGRLKLWQISLHAGGQRVALAQALAQCMRPVPIPPSAPTPPAAPPGPHDLDPAQLAAHLHRRRPEPGHTLQGRLEIRPLSPWELSGHCTSWVRLPVQVLAGIPRTPLLHAIMLSDIANGAGHLTLSPTLGSINADITLSLYRAPASEWLALRATNLFQPHGTGVIHAELFDEQGGLGHILQTVQAQTRQPRPQ